jgi:flavin reductase (DIM6/NTAB) family NADH-FMN oxidoreductase RutF
MPIDTPRFRQVIGHFATGVTVITTAVDGWLHGMTANAITSVSLEPLLLLICVEKSANMHGQLAKTKRFAVNVLSEKQEDISRIFAATTEPEEGRLQGVAFTTGPNGAPLIDNCLAYISCEIAVEHHGGDHTIFIASVTEGEVASEGRPLLFYRGGYRQMAD